jgi:hypothetical protein
VERVVVYGNGGSGKSTLARAVATAIGADAIEIDAIAFVGEYEHVDPSVLRPRFERALAARRWVVEGMHRDELHLALDRADTFVWLDLPRRTIARRLAGRTLVHLLTGRKRHGRRVTLGTIRRRELPFLRKTLSNHERRRAHGSSFLAAAAERGVTAVHLTSARRARRWLAEVRR